mgnify:FL=1
MQDQFDDAFYPLIWAHVQQYQRCVIKYGEKERITKKVKESLNGCVQKWSDLPATMASAKVIDFFNSEFPHLDPFTITWHQKYLVGKDDKKRGMIVWEHTTPLNILLKELITKKSQEEVNECMNSYSGVCLITREEDDVLNENKMRTVRPGGWEECYALCGIDVVRRDI